MKKIIEITLHPADVHDADKIRVAAARLLECAPEEISALKVLKRSLDARPRVPVYKCTVAVYSNEEPEPLANLPRYTPVADSASSIHIAGFGPAGMFAALRLIEMGYRPIVYERGKAVRERRRDIKALMQEHIVNDQSNYCFGEGGAGTFSDGKLYTRSNKRGDVGRILTILNQHGAVADILVDAHPHIGSNKLPKIVQAIRETILRCGGEVHFESCITDILYENGTIKALQINHDNEVPCSALILAVGHSARDVFRLLQKRQIYIEPKPFAVGVRIEHSQRFINETQYHAREVMHYLPAAAYSVACQADGKGVFSFCMCPGGLVVPASTAPGEIVLNGMSVSKRNSPFANAGFVVTVDEGDWGDRYKGDPLSGMYYQMDIETRAYHLSMSQAAPAQRAVDFLMRRMSSSLPSSSYIPGLIAADLRQVLPGAVADALRSGLQLVNKKMRGFASEDALLLAPETRTSSPVRVKRDKENRMHVALRGLFPAGEGAGYAGGIVSAAIDGEQSAEAAVKYLAGV
jgi:hypothetical protein